MKAFSEPEPLTIVVTDLIDHGLISVPTTVFGIHSGVRIEARIAITYRPIGQGKNRDLAEQAKEVGQRLHGVLSQLARAGLPATPMQAWEVYGLVRSHRLRPAPWKLEAARKAAAYYRGWWKSHKDPAFVPWQTAACAELHGKMDPLKLNA